MNEVAAVPSADESYADHESEVSDEAADLAVALGRSLRARGWTIAVAESLTGGLLVQAMAQTEGSGDWLAGGVVAYSRTVKRRVLDVVADKVVSCAAAVQMASGARAALGADVAVSATGVAGPDEQDGEPPGTVWIGIDTGTEASADRFEAAGSPSEICQATVAEALRRVRAAADRAPEP